MLGLGRISSKKEFITYGFDFTKYANQGFLFTPLELVDRPYEGRGIIRIEGWPDITQQVHYTTNPSGHTMDDSKFLKGKVEPSEIIEVAYNYAKSIGADAIIQFKIIKITGIRGNIQVDGMELQGFAIKRL